MGEARDGAAMHDQREELHDVVAPGAGVSGHGPKPETPERGWSCEHGATADIRPVGGQPGRWQRFAAACKLCKGEPSGLAFKVERDSDG